ncbi:TIGR01906 family membrane protein [Tepidibacter formicigenes]|jgi:integral membrane protein (TIGR01906 family)|uniref:Integral membrane protein TIGR01906 n=1 Tax=Tepidibacter formicigenes DSM 15518 TaxID=1123349 RepID=A0A1M6P4Q8_9FIRM|nr:TIGR01906 family membrane protein [Tepidibacter formicigenes]SHK02911.1 integral membrane protein TIGR01906 [Tepidibacter formicigenes DSM 15518]
MKKAIYYSFGFLLFLIILLNTAQFYSLNNFFYFSEYDKNNVYKNVKYSKEDIKNITYNLTNYLSNSDKKLDYKKVFGIKEIKHMKDVKILFNLGLTIKNLITVVVITIVILSFKDYKNLLYFTNKSLIIVNIFFLFICSLISLSYYNSFTLFHKIFFSNDLWLLNPKESIIINLLPLEFFKHISMYIFITNLIINSIIIILLTYINKKIKKVKV